MNLIDIYNDEKKNTFDLEETQRRMNNKLLDELIIINENECTLSNEKLIEYLAIQNNMATEKYRLFQSEIEKLQKTIENLSNNNKDNNNYRKEIKDLSNCKVINNLKEILIKKGISQSKVSDRIGISSKTMSNIVSNRYNTSLDVALKIAYVLDESFENIFKLENIEETTVLEK